MIRIMFVCHGNICRSPMAEFVMKDIVRRNNMEEEFIINSSATSNEEIGNSIHRGTKEKLKNENIFCGEHKAIRLTKADYDKYDYILAMDSNNLKGIFDIIEEDPKKKVKLLLSYANEKRENIADPWYTGNFDITFEDIKRSCESLMTIL
ncbi:MAG: low molecular weight protein-tyrosine-phosphatase [Synergistaceae bacterium]